MDDVSIANDEYDIGVLGDSIANLCIIWLENVTTLFCL